MLDYLLEAFAGPGGGFMYAITALLAFAVAVGLERAFMLLVKWRVDDVALRGALASGDVSAAAKIAPGTPVGDVVTAGAGQTDPDAAWDAMGAAAADAEARLSKRVDYVGVVANMATMLGLLGTVYGLMLAFSGLGDASAGQRAVRLSEGISTAMATTAFGLLVGIPALGLHAWLAALVRVRLAQIEAVAGQVVLAIRRSASAD
ncbi:MAG: MotA/TolQ/ExbB proton channel family protein [Proteobacteria bacterium]|nr:MotA/TolQ/ExbB proton channel family protein [Pseudomonadota bacterium]MCP4918875.1 MotA/TolQ/ExbB proton channel family protein [Pseudomonadota bacterium]